MYLPLSESLGSRMWSQISSSVVPTLTRSPLSRRFSLDRRTKKCLTWLSSSCWLAVGYRHPLPQTPLLGFSFQICGLAIHPSIIHSFACSFSKSVAHQLCSNVESVLVTCSAGSKETGLPGQCPPPPPPSGSLPHLFILLSSNPSSVSSNNHPSLALKNHRNSFLSLLKCYFWRHLVHVFSVGSQR